MNIKNKSLWVISMTGLLAISYYLCRFLFFEIHGMKSWPNTLAMVALVIIVITSIFGKRITSVASLVGYVGGFVLSMIFNTDRVDQGGGLINNAWLIWGGIFVLSILIGIILEFISDKKQKNIRFR